MNDARAMKTGKTGKTVSAVAMGLMALTLGCSNPADKKLRFTHPETYAALSKAQEQQVQALRAEAQADPRDYEAQKAAGMMMMEYALAGVLPLQAEAETYLERAFELRQDDEELLRTLGRFYNMRAVEHDFSKAATQREVYDALLEGEEPGEMSVDHFVAYSFWMLARIIQAADDKKMMLAFRELQELEKQLEKRTRAQPDNVELHALAGNFALFFAGYVPVGKKRRIRTGIAHFEYVRDNWTEMRAGARDPVRCPNTFENFMFELAEAYLVLRESESAADLYRSLASPSEPVTRGKELVAAASEHRLDNLDRYVGRTELMPPWPSDLGNCIVCHSYTGDLPQNTLWVAKGLEVDLLSTPTKAEFREVRMAQAPTSDSPLQENCAPCHFDGGRAQHLLDLGDPEAVAKSRQAIIDSVESGWMPPDREMSAEDQRIVVDWVRQFAIE